MGGLGNKQAQHRNGSFLLRVPLKVSVGVGSREASQNCPSVHLPRTGYKESECNSPIASPMAKYITVGSLMRNFLLQLFLFLPLYYYCLLFLPHQHAVGPVPTFFPPNRHPTDNCQGWVEQFLGCVKSEMLIHEALGSYFLTVSFL